MVSSRSVGHRLQVAALLEQAGHIPAHLRDGSMACDVSAGELGAVATEIIDLLPAEILDSARAAFSSDQPMAAPRDAVPTLRTLRMLLRGAERGWLIDILKEDRLDTHFQPIVDVGSGFRPVAHECLTRGRTAEGGSIPPLRLFAAAERAALLFHLDRSARLTSIENAARFDPAGRYFVNFTPTAIYNPAYCLKSTVEAVEEGGIAPSQVTFEVIESVQMRDLPHLGKIFAVYRARGFTVALDDITGGPISGEMIKTLRPDYVKLDRSIISFVDTSGRNQRSIVEVLRLCRSLGIEVIAEGIERPEERDWLASAGIHLMQGYLFGRPRPILAPNGSPLLGERGPRKG